MTKIASLAGFALLSVLLLPTNSYAGPVNHSPATENLRLEFAEVVDTAIDQCREELAGDVFANFRLEACVEGKVTDFIEKSDVPTLAAYAADTESFLVASAP